MSARASRRAKRHLQARRKLWEKLPDMEHYHHRDKRSCKPPGSQNPKK